MFSATAAQRTYSPLLWRPFRSIGSQDLYLDVVGPVYRLEEVHNAGSVSILREEEERLKAGCWQRRPCVRLEGLELSSDLLRAYGHPSGIVNTRNSWMLDLVS